MHKRVEPDGMHPQVLMELASAIAKLLLNIFERSWQMEEVAKDWKKANTTLSLTSETLHGSDHTEVTHSFLSDLHRKLSSL